MIHSLATYFSGLPPVFTDGMLYVLVAIFAFQNSVLSSDDAAKYISPGLLFWMKFTIGSLAAGALALKLFRSTAFADHQQQKKAETSFMTRQAP